MFSSIHKTIAGGITERKVVTSTGAAFSNSVGAKDIVFDTADLSADGRFKGTASGGAFTQSGATFTGTGQSFEGMIGGDADGVATSVAGAFTMDQAKSDGNQYRETGVFVAD